VIQYLYDSHYDGAEAVEGYVEEWRGLKGLVDERRYNEILAQLEYQAGQAEVWRDAVTNWFFRASGIPDAKGRVEHYPGRLEAESAQLQDYKVTDVTPWEAASEGKAVTCGSAQCTATFSYSGQPGWFDLRVQYFDQDNGSARYRAWLNDQLVDQWTAADHLPTQKIDGSSSTRRTIRGLALRPGDLIRIEGSPDGDEAAALDYIEVVEQKR
jgi:alpha-glucuronidase